LKSNIIFVTGFGSHQARCSTITIVMGAESTINSSLPLSKPAAHPGHHYCIILLKECCCCC